MSLDRFIREEVSYRYRPLNEWSPDFRRGIQAGMARSLETIGALLEKPHLVFGQAARDAVSPEYIIEKIKRMREHPVLHNLGILKLAEALRL